jgi:hypothetical protein
MKKILLLVFLAVAAFAVESNAQLLKTTVPTKDTTVNADSTLFTLTCITNDVVSFHVTAAKESGTVAGKMVIYGSINNSDWKPLDSMSLANVTYNHYTYSPSGLFYSQYRVKVVTSGTCKINTIRGHGLRRSK